MKTKNHYLAAQTSENGKNYAFVIKLSESDNVLSILARYKNLASANMCSTKKEASEIVKFWNGCFIANHTYMFDNAPLF